MILLLSCFITNERIRKVSNKNRYSRFDVFKYTLFSYKDLPFTELYLFILLDQEFKDREQELTEYIHSTFSNLHADKIHIVPDRYNQQKHWASIMNILMKKHGPDEMVWFTQNDDHVFIDFNMDILNEGLELVKHDKHPHKSIYFSHWPEILKMSGKFEEPILTGNYIKFNRTMLDSIQIFNLNYLYFMMVRYKWKTNHNRIDSLLSEITNRGNDDNVFNQTIYVPLREMARHFDGYSFADNTICPELVLPSNTFHYSKESLIKNMTAEHHTQWTVNNNFQIPKKWIDINLSLHPDNLEHII
jgi:hypothetical protein